jgi:hypothetical protein
MTRTRLAPILVVGLIALIAPLVAAAAPNDPPLTKGDITISSDPDEVVYGKATTISGKLKGTLKAGALVTLQQKPHPYTGDYETVATTTTATNGDYEFKDVDPLKNTRYRVTTTVPQTVSAEILVKVRIKLTLRLSDSTPRAGQRVRFAGTAAPEHDGRTVYIQRRTLTGRWRTVKQTTLADVGTEFSKYAKRIRVRRDGTYRARVFHDADHQDGTSPARRAAVH